MDIKSNNGIISSKFCFICRCKYSTSTKTVVTNNNISYNYVPSLSLINDKQGGTALDVDGNIRYYGASPNNYVYFNCSTYPTTNCELWRIIGTFGDKIKIVRNESIGKYSWDNKDKTTGAETNYGKMTGPMLD